MSCAAVRTVLVIGIGAGHPGHLTAQARDGLARADVIFELARDTGDLTALRREICAAHLDRFPPVVRIAEPRRERTAPDYVAAVGRWRERRAEVWETAIQQLGLGLTGAFLVWGDPSLYDSTIAVLDDVARRGRVAFGREVIPGVSSLHALTARHGITLNRVGGAVQITTGRRLAEHGLPDGADDVAVMLDGGCAFQTVREPGVTIYWGAYLGTPDEILLHGPLAEVSEVIVAARAAARERKGGGMGRDLLRRALGGGRWVSTPSSAASRSPTLAPGGRGGRLTTITASPRSRAASSFARVSSPPLSLVMRRSIRWRSMSSPSPARV